MTSKEELTKIFEKYTITAGMYLSRLRVSQSKVAYLSLAQRARLLEAVEYLEPKPAFHELVEATRDTYRQNSPHSSQVFRVWESAVKCFFRRKGFYLNCFNGEATIDLAKTFVQYDNAFTACEVPVTYLVPLEGVAFCETRNGVNHLREQSINLGDFILRRFSKEELINLAGNRTNEVFYPYAVWDVEKLSRYWFIVIKSRKEVLGLGLILFDFSDLPDLNYIRRKSLPKLLFPLHPALYKLILWDWLPERFQVEEWPNELSGCQWSELGICFSVERALNSKNRLILEPWHGFRLPFRLEVNEDLIHPPPPAPGLDTLETEIRSGFEGEEVEWPVEWFELKDKPTVELEKFIREDLAVLDASLLEKWPFFEVALEYATKAFFTDPFDDAPQQLLWHITALEALLGKKEDEKLTKTMAGRLARLLGRNAEERNRIAYNFRRLYEIRSDLVHGNPWENYSTLYLYLARNLARRACLRFLELARNCIQESRQLPEREQILTAIDQGCFEKLAGGGS